MLYDPMGLNVSNRADWLDTIEIRDGDNALVDLEDASIVFEVRRPNRPDDTPLLSATTANGKVTIAGDGLAEFHFLRSEMIAVSPGSYDLGVTITRDSLTDQLFVASVLIYDGIVRK